MNNCIIYQVPKEKDSLLKEVFQLATSRDDLEIERSCRILGFYNDLLQQKNENYCLIMTNYSKSDIRTWLNDLIKHYENQGNSQKKSQVQTFLKSL